MAATKDQILESISNMTVMEVVELISEMEEKFGVTAAAPVAAAAPAASGDAASAAEEKTSSGIIIPDTAKEKPQKGKIVAVGNGTKDEKITVKVGETVLYGKYSGTEINIDGTDYLIMKESDIFGII